MFARDFQYRKELKSHIENRLQNAEKRRRSIRQRSIEVKPSDTYSKVSNKRPVFTLTSHSAYDVMSTELFGVKINGFLYPNFM